MRTIRTMVNFLGLWLATTLALAQCVTSWFIPLLAQPWHVIPLSGALALLLLIMLL